VRKPIDEVASFILMDLLQSKGVGIDIVSLPEHSEVVNILESFFKWADKYNKIKEEDLLDISSLSK